MASIIRIFTIKQNFNKSVISKALKPNIYIVVGSEPRILKLNDTSKRLNKLKLTEHQFADIIYSEEYFPIVFKF